MEAAFFLSVLAILVSTLYLVDIYLNSSLANDASEPPVIKAPNFTPIIGHIIGFARHGIEYYTRLCQQITDPSPSTKVQVEGSDNAGSAPSIFTVRVLGNFKLYVVNSPSMLGPLQRAAKTVSFLPFERLTVQQFAHAPAGELNFLDEPTGAPGSGDGKFMHDMHRIITRTLAPGPDLDKMNEVTANGFLEALDELVEKCDASVDKEGGLVLDFYYWIRETVTIHSGRGVYGPASPYDDKKARDAFW